MVSAKAMQCDMVIIGGGICGLLAARQCRDMGLSYTLIEREKRLGGNWHTKANDHSFLQVQCVCLQLLHLMSSGQRL